MVRGDSIMQSYAVTDKAYCRFMVGTVSNELTSCKMFLRLLTFDVSFLYLQGNTNGM